jgi:ABC-type multidrug transport system ATPase subunit/pSer/pThr/pTyr-binding forkhead associated (FHA) protein
MSILCPHCSTPQRNPQSHYCWRCGKPLTAALAVSTAALLIRVPNQAPVSQAVSKPVFTLGRAADNDLVLNYPTVSNYHARLEQRGTSYHVIDLGSTNGTTVNGQRIALQQPQPLQAGDILRIGDLQGNSISLTFQDTGGAARRGTIVLDPARFAATQLTLGRDPQSDVPLPSPMASWHHARIDHTPQGNVLHDLGSTNGTFVNGQRITRHVLRQGDLIQIGPLRLAYTAAGLAPAADVGHIRLDGVHLKRRVKDRKSGGVKFILNDVTLSIQPGEFVAVVGGSGAGKSTLVKALNGQSRADEGYVLLNGDDFYVHFDQYRLQLGYVPQDDIVHRDLTVENALRYAARLRLPPDTQAVEIERRIDDVLRRLDMLDERKDTIATLSGGQRKRVNIAVEMLADPDLFFLDEPSSGLDPGTEKKLMYDMQRVADSGKTIILITHATDNVGLCDHIAFMGSGGHLVFFGPPGEALTFFQAQSYADIYLKLNNAQEVQRWRQVYEQSSYYQQYVVNRVSTAARPANAAATPRSPHRLGVAGSARQFGILTQRYLELIFRNKFSLFVLLAVMPIIGLLLLMISKPFWLTGKYDPACAGINWDSPTAITQCVEQHLAEELETGNSATYTIANQAQVLLFMLAFASSLLGVFAAAFEIVKEKPIYERERMINLNLGAYLLSKFMVLAGFAIVQSLLLLAVIGLGVRLPTEALLLPVPIELYVSLLLTIWASVGLGLWVSALVPNRDVVVYGMLLVLIVQIIFAGVLFDLPREVRPVSGITVTRWSLDALGTSARLNELNQYGQSWVRPDISKTVDKEVEVDVGGGRTVTQEISLTVEYTDTVSTSIAPEFQLAYGCTDTIEQVNSDGKTAEIVQFDAACSRGSLIGNWLILGVFAIGFTALAGLTLKVKERAAQ